jgi:hypothetical protein
MDGAKSYKTAGAFRAALETRLQTRARDQGTDLQRLRRQVCPEFFRSEGLQPAQARMPALPLIQSQAHRLVRPANPLRVYPILEWIAHVGELTPQALVCSWVVASHTPLSAVLLGLSRRINTILSFT